MTSSDGQGTVSSKNSEIKLEYSLNDIIKLDFEELNGKIFTYDKRLSQGDLSKIKEYENQELTNILSQLKCMKGIDKSFVPTFKYF